MFKFGFSDDNSNQGGDDGEINSQLEWFPAEEINLIDEQFTHDYDSGDLNIISITHDINIKLIRSENILMKLKDDECKNIIKAESQHSDLLPAVYEGGLKIWECSYDLGEYLLTQNIPLENLKVLDLGCGSGILGIVALLRGSTVHFQDYNREVIELLTIPNVLLNSNNHELIREKIKFYSGDWRTFTELLTSKYPNEDEKYDLILSSETIYNSDNQKKLYEVFKKCLKINGVGYIAGKTYYFGVGGGMRQFERVIAEDRTFNTEIVWKSTEGLQREIIKLTHQ